MASPTVSDQLTLEDIRDVLSALWDARSKWYDIGLQLGIDPVALDAIRMEDRDDPSNCLRSAIRIYLTNPSHNKSWSAIVCALNSPPVSFHLLTNELESKFLSVGDVATQKSDAETATPEYKLEPTHLDAVPTLRQVQVLRSQNMKVRILSSVWWVVGDLLEFDDGGAKLMDIELSYPNDPEICYRAVFQHWLKGGGVRPCSWRKLIEIIDDIDQKMLVKEIKAVLPYDMEPQRE